MKDPGEKEGLTVKEHD